MKIVQKGEFYGDIIQTTLENRDINDMEKFLAPELSTESDPRDLTNSYEARKLLEYHLAKNNLIGILVDADADGFTSAATLWRYILEFMPEARLEYIVHSSKAHGLTDLVMEELKEMNLDLLLIPDAGSNDVAQIEELESKGTNVIVLDHHHVTKFTYDGIIVNNQLCPMTNNQLVGVGVVYKFIQGIDENYGYDYADQFLDLVAVGQIGDASDISDPEIRKLVLTGVDNINNPFLKVAINNMLGFNAMLAPKQLSFSVIPLINAVTRVGTTEERELLFEALAGIGHDRKFKVVKKKKDKTTGKFNNVEFTFNLYEYAYDVFTKVKARQAAVTKKLVPIIEKNMFKDAGVLIGFSPDLEYPGISGLVANKLVSKYDKPALLLNEKEDHWTGSGRGHEKTILDFRAWCSDSGLVEFAEGHAGAFGISILKENLDKFKEYARKIDSNEIVYEVDLITNKPDTTHCEAVDANGRLFGGKVSPPFVGIVGLNVPKKFINFKGSMLSIYSWGVNIVQFSCSESFAKEIEDYPGEDVILNMVGEYSMNNWSGRLQPQFVVKDIELEKNEEEITVENIIF